MLKPRPTAHITDEDIQELIKRSPGPTMRQVLETFGLPLDDYPDPDYPNARAAAAVLRVYPDGDKSWLIPECPYCGKEHIHGSGDDHKRSLGHRWAHCMERTGDSSNGYVLIDAGKPPIIVALKKRRRR